MTSTAPSVDSLDMAALARGTRQVFRLRIDELDTDATMSIPVNVVVGAAAGPTVAAVAGVHGDEVEGVLALLELWEELQPELLAGTLVVVPVANPPAFAAHRRTSPLDDLDLNRIFPGRPDGSPSERLAHRLFTEVLRQADFLFSMHSWHATGSVLPYVEFGHLFPDTAAKSYDAAVACGFDLIRISHWSPGLMTRVANEQGIPGIEVELGGQGVSQGNHRARYKLYLRKLLRHLGMLEGKVNRSTPPRVVCHLDVSASTGGVLRPAVELGAEVDKGDRLATLYDLNCQPLEDIRAPARGLVAAVHEAVSVGPGSHLFRLFQDFDYPARTHGEPEKESNSKD